MDIDILFFTFVGSRKATFDYTFLSIFLYLCICQVEGDNPNVDTYI